MVPVSYTHLRYSKEEALKAVDTSETAILNADDDFSIMSLYSILQENEREIKPAGTKLDLIILGIDEKMCIRDRS